MEVCTNCNSTNIQTERRMDGNSTCLDCKFVETYQDRIKKTNGKTCQFCSRSNAFETRLSGKRICLHCGIEQIADNIIKIKYFDEEMPKIENIQGKSDWYDLRAAKCMLIEKDQFALIPLGIAMQLPAGYEAYVIPRSSTFKKWKIIQANHMGMIDESYCGNNDQWFFPAIALEDTFIDKYDRICQFRIQKKQPVINFVEVLELNSENRGGFGSTGDK